MHNSRNVTIFKWIDHDELYNLRQIVQGETLLVKLCNAFAVSALISKPISDSMFMFMLAGAYNNKKETDSASDTHGNVWTT